MKILEDLAVKINDEILCAYLDGELSKENRAAVELAIEKSPEVLKRLEVFNNIDDLFAKTYRTIDDKPMPDGVLSMLQTFSQKPLTENQLGGGNQHSFDGNGSAVNKKSFWSVAIAASIALLIGIGIDRVFLISKPNVNQTPEIIFAQQTVGVIEPENALFDILEKQPSGSSVILSQSTSTIVTPVMTFKKGGSGYCREFNITSLGEGTKNIACRGGNNVWVVEVAVKVDDPSLFVSGLYQTATSQNEPIIDAAVRHLIEGDVLNIDAEAFLIRKKWQMD